MRVRILEAAERIVSDMGAARLRLDLVAEVAGVSKGGLLYHFGSKESLLSALTERYVQGMEQCVEQARDALGDTSDSSGLKALIIGVLGDNPRSKALGAALLATLANAPTLLEPVRERMASHARQLATSDVNFARAAIVTLAVDGLMLHESLGISPFTRGQRAALVSELMKLADESHS